MNTQATPPTPLSDYEVSVRRVFRDLNALMITTRVQADQVKTPGVTIIGKRMRYNPWKTSALGTEAETLAGLLRAAVMQASNVLTQIDKQKEDGEDGETRTYDGRKFRDLSDAEKLELNRQEEEARREHHPFGWATSPATDAQS